MPMVFHFAPDIQDKIGKIVLNTGLRYIDPTKIKCFRSVGSKSKVRARIWSFPKIWQLALKVEPHYIIEVISEKFDKLNEAEKNKILIHELLHIPKNFSGSLLPHRSRGRSINLDVINKLFKKMETK